jgi:hypothetical protein
MSQDTKECANGPSSGSLRIQESGPQARAVLSMLSMSRSSFDGKGDGARACCRLEDEGLNPDRPTFRHVFLGKDRGFSLSRQKLFRPCLASLRLIVESPRSTGRTSGDQP